MKERKKKEKVQNEFDDFMEHEIVEGEIKWHQKKGKIAKTPRNQTFMAEGETDRKKQMKVYYNKRTKTERKTFIFEQGRAS